MNWRRRIEQVRRISGLRNSVYVPIFCVLHLLAPAALRAQSTTFKDVKVRFNRSEKDPRLVDKDANLILDGKSGMLIVKSSEHPISIPYAAVLRVQFEMTTHMRAGALGQIVTVAGSAVGVPQIGTTISGRKVSDYWCYIEYRDGNRSRNEMLEIEKDISERVIDAMMQAFGDRVTRIEFAEHAESVDKKKLPDLQSKHSLKADKTNHPLPRVEEGKALIVVVCPPLAARSSGRSTQFKIHANDRAVIVNKAGTYSFAYLEPGEYLLVSQAENASGFRIQLEAGKEYYFLQNIVVGAFKAGTTLSRNSKELVMHELSGASFADWKRTK